MSTELRAGPLETQFRLSESGSQVDIQLVDPRRTPIECKGASDWSVAISLSKTASRRLQDILRILPGRSQFTSQERDRALEDLRALGVFIWTKLLGNYRSQPPVIAPGTLDETALASVEVVCPNDMVLPVELLPILEPVFRSDQSSLVDAAALVGFGAETHRRLPTPGNLPTTPVDKAAVSFYWDANLRGARREFRAMSQRFGSGLREPSPQQRKVKAADVAGQIVSALSQGPSHDPAAVEHFSCHHKRGEGDKSSDILLLRARGLLTGRIRITADDLTARSYGQPRKPGLVFLNACKTQVISADTVSAVVRELMECGRTVVVATWCDVPDGVAELMSSFFYAALQDGNTVGQSLRRARLRLLLEHNNPLGLLYTVFGDSTYTLVEG